MKEAEKVTLLAEKIGPVVGDLANRVRLPNQKIPVLLLDVSRWAEVSEVKNGLTQAGDSVAGDVDNNMTIRKNAGGRGDFVAWVVLPNGGAIKLSEAKVVIVGWPRCRVRLLEKNLPTCYRCQQKGHVAAECQNEPEKWQCYQCQAEDYQARDCKQPWTEWQRKPQEEK